MKQLYFWSAMEDFKCQFFVRLILRNQLNLYIENDAKLFAKTGNLVSAINFSSNLSSDGSKR